MVTSLTAKVNSIPCTVPRNLKEIHNYPAIGKMTNIKRKHGFSGRCCDAVNINIAPVLLL